MRDHLINGGNLNLNTGWIVKTHITNTNIQMRNLLNTRFHMRAHHQKLGSSRRAGVFDQAKYAHKNPKPIPRRMAISLRRTTGRLHMFVFAIAYNVNI
jgi:hypothetical protein